MERLKALRILSSGAFAAIIAVTAIVAAALTPFFPYWMQQLPKPRTDRPFLAEPAPPGTRRHVLLFLLDGVGPRVAYGRDRMPLLLARLPATAYGIGLAHFPTITPSGLRAIMSGHHALPHAEFSDTQMEPEADSVLRRASEAGLKVFVVGQQYWPMMFGAHGAKISVIEYSHSEGGVKAANYDASVYAAARATLLKGPKAWDFMVVHLFGGDLTAHAYGTEGPQYRQVLRQIDVYVDELSKLAGPDATVMITADHGQKPSGNHGGMSDEETQVPFIFYGEGVLPGRLRKVYSHYDFPATAAALLGVPPPRECDGVPVLEAFDLTERSRSWALGVALQQKRQRWYDNREMWPWLKGAPDAVVGRVAELRRRSDWKSASRAAATAISLLDARIEEASPSRWFGRYVISEALLASAAMLVFLWLETPAVSLATVLLGAAAIGGFAVSLVTPRYCPEASYLVAVCVAALIGLAFRQGYRNGPLPWSHWAAVGFGLFGLALPVIFDKELWSWFALGMAAIVTYPTRLKRLRPAIFFTAVLGLLGAAAYAGPFMPIGEGSVVRELIPTSASMGARVDWHRWEWVLLAGCALALGDSLSHVLRRLRFVLVVVACAPLAMAFLPITDAGYLSFIWGMAAVIALLSFVLPLPADTRGLWIALAALAFHRTVSLPAVNTRLMIAALLGWILAQDGRHRAPIWNAVTLVGLTIWGYQMAGYNFNVSSLPITAAFNLLRDAWTPSAILRIVVLRQIVALLAPILPLAWVFTWDSVGLAIPLWLAVSAGEMISLFLERFTFTRANGWVDDEVFVRALTAAVIAGTFYLIVIVRGFALGQASRSRLSAPPRAA